MIEYVAFIVGILIATGLFRTGRRLRDKQMQYAVAVEHELEALPMDMQRIMTTSVELYDKLTEQAEKEGVELELMAVGICAEVRFPCPDGGDHFHSTVIPVSTPDSDVHSTALFELAAENIGIDLGLDSDEVHDV